MREGRSSREVDAFCVQFAPRAPGHPAVRDLQQLLADVPQEGARGAAAVGGAVGGMAARPQARPGVDGARRARGPRGGHRASRCWCGCWRTRAAARQSVGALVREVLAGTSGLKLFAQVGLLAGQGFLGEVSDRLARRLLPAPPEDRQLSASCCRASFRSRRTPPGWRPCPRRCWHGSPRCWASETLPPARGPAADGARRPGGRALPAGRADGGPGPHRGRAGPLPGGTSLPLLALPALRRVSEGVLARDARAGQRCGSWADVLEECRQVVATCTQPPGDVRGERGPGVPAGAHPPEPGAHGGHRPGAGARRPARPAGARGSRCWRTCCAARTRTARCARWWRATCGCWRARSSSARGPLAASTTSPPPAPSTTTWCTRRPAAGCSPPFTAGLKFVARHARAGALLLRAVAALNYVGSFVLMQLLGFTLATKQPSMTAATLGGRASSQGGRGRAAVAPGGAHPPHHPLAARHGAGQPGHRAAGGGGRCRWSSQWWKGRPLLNDGPGAVRGGQRCTPGRAAPSSTRR